LILLEPLQAQVLALNQTLQVREGFSELLEDVRRAVAVPGRIILRIHGVHDDKCLLTLRRLRIERPKQGMKHHSTIIFYQIIP